MKIIIVFYLMSCFLTGCNQLNISSSRSSKIEEQKNITLEEKQNDIDSEKLSAWNGTKWGMSSSQVANIFPDISSDEAYFCPRIVRTNCTAYSINNYEIASKKYKILFTFIDDKLIEVDLICSPDKNIKTGFNSLECVGTHQDIEYLLTSKYGEPFKQETIKKSKRVYWNLNNKKITIRSSLYSILVIYKPHQETFSVDSESIDKEKNKI